MNENNTLVPFGKYKGQPIEAMAQDQQYVEWLTQQPWFKERYQKIYTVIINNFREPSNTPEHNALQARFLDDEFRLKFASIAIPRLWWHVKSDGEMVDKMIASAVNDYKDCKKRCDELSKYYRGKTEYVPQMFCRDRGPLAEIGKPSFEVGGVDCSFSVTAGLSCRSNVFRDGQELYRSDDNRGVEFGSYLGISRHGEVDLKIEIKPEIGDDYPAILRQMRANESRFLFTRAYIGLGVNEETFIQFMDSQGIRVIYEHEVDQAELLVIEEFDPQQFFAAVRRALNPETFDLDSI